MADSSTTHPDQPVELDTVDAKIVGFTARHTAGKDFQSAAVEVEYRLSRPADYHDAVQFFGDAQRIAEEHAEAKLADTIARRNASAAAVQPQPAAQPAPAPAPAPAPQAQPTPTPVPVQPQAPHPAASAPAPQPSPDMLVEQQLGGQQLTQQQPGGMPVSVGTTPKGAQIRYVPTSALPSQAFEQAIRQQIAGHGFDETQFAVFDNRTGGGPYPGFEEGGSNYSAATIKARNDSKAQQVIGKGNAFYADFDEQGVLTVKPSKDALAYKAAAAAFA